MHFMGGAKFLQLRGPGLPPQTLELAEEERFRALIHRREMFLHSVNEQTHNITISIGSGLLPKKFLLIQHLPNY
jgi:hypothetical protein